MDATANDFSNPDDILSNDGTAAAVDGAANTGDGSATFDDNSTTGTVASASASPSPASSSGPSWLSSLWGAVAPSVETAAGAAAQKALGNLATQAKTATAKNAAATAPVATVGGFSVNTLLMIGAGVLALVLIVPRLGGKK